jgi:hypothetical protein
MHPATWRALQRRIAAMRQQALAEPMGRLPLLRARPDRCLSCGVHLPPGRRHRCALCSDAAAFVLYLFRERC